MQEHMYNKFYRMKYFQNMKSLAYILSDFYCERFIYNGKILAVEGLTMT